MVFYRVQLIIVSTVPSIFVDVTTLLTETCVEVKLEAAVRSERANHTSFPPPFAIHCKLEEQSITVLLSFVGQTSDSVADIETHTQANLAQLLVPDYDRCVGHAIIGEVISVCV